MFTKLSDRSYYEIEKIKALKSNKWPRPNDIKFCLGDTLGSLVIDLIPNDILQQLKIDLHGREVPANFEVTSKNVLLNNIKLTETGIKNEALLFINTIKRKYNFKIILNNQIFHILFCYTTVLGFGNYFNEQVPIIMGDKFVDQLKKRMTELMVKLSDKVLEEEFKVRKTLEHKYNKVEIEMMDKHDVLLTVSQFINADKLSKT